MWILKPQPKPDFRGMTTNERLFAVGLMDKFDSAARKRDRARRPILEAIRLAVEFGNGCRVIPLNHPDTRIPT
jgi:hypothetical protein